MSGAPLAIALAQSRSDILVQQLRDLPTPLPAFPTPNGVEKPGERRRRQLYDQIRHLGPEGVLALSRGLHDDDVELRKNVALALSVLAGAWFDPSWPKLDIKTALPALIVALQDSDSECARLVSASDWRDRPRCGVCSAGTDNAIL